MTLNHYFNYGGSGGKESAYNAGDVGSIFEAGQIPGERNGYPLQYSCLENSMDRAAWWAIVLGISRVGYDLATQPPPSPPSVCLFMGPVEKRTDI